MQHQPLSQIEEVLGKEVTDLPPGYSAIELVVEKSDVHLEYYLPNPYREVTLMARERGFEMSSHDKSYKMRRDFSIPFSAVKQVKLLPSFSLGKRPALSIGYIAGSMAVFALLGIFVTRQDEFVVWAAFGWVFGCFLSMAYNKKLRPNIFFALEIDGRTENIYFSVGKNQLEKCIFIFNLLCGDVFNDDREAK